MDSDQKDFDPKKINKLDLEKRIDRKLRDILLLIRQNSTIKYGIRPTPDLTLSSKGQKFETYAKEFVKNLLLPSSKERLDFKIPYLHTNKFNIQHVLSLDQKKVEMLSLSFFEENLMPHKIKILRNFPNFIKYMPRVTKLIELSACWISQKQTMKILIASPSCEAIFFKSCQFGVGTIKTTSKIRLKLKLIEFSRCRTRLNSYTSCIEADEDTHPKDDFCCVFLENLINSFNINLLKQINFSICQVNMTQLHKIMEKDCFQNLRLSTTENSGNWINIFHES
ncbi:unnamed protein product [Moneuplotes crassus]|uniref:Uncharacterized protein n=1 Tax=Euplotes crassus TaxID=5936 RepID=A0AAD2D2X1_EUPCR|nr:unnamed protein product [Moneuplotes crassus]